MTKPARIRVKDGKSARKGAFLGSNNTLPLSAEQHCLSFVEVEDLGALHETSKLHRELVARYLKDAREITASAQSVATEEIVDEGAITLARSALTLPLVQRTTISIAPLCASACTWCCGMRSHCSGSQLSLASLDKTAPTCG